MLTPYLVFQTYLYHNQSQPQYSVGEKVLSTELHDEPRVDITNYKGVTLQASLYAARNKPRQLVFIWKLYYKCINAKNTRLFNIYDVRKLIAAEGLELISSFQNKFVNCSKWPTIYHKGNLITNN